MPTRFATGRFRVFAAALVLTLTAAALPALAASNGMPTQWTLSHYNPEMNPVVGGPSGTIDWTFAMNRGTSATPSVVDGIVYRSRPRTWCISTASAEA